jgi:mannose-1-phosphate guanylyltransferase
MIQQNARLGSVVIDAGDWWDLGSRDQILEVHSRLALRSPRGPWVDPSASVAPDAFLSTGTAVGARSQIGSGASLTECVVWEDARIAPGSQLHRCIVTSGAVVCGRHADADL